jgi:hypothetical protein
MHHERSAGGNPAQLSFIAFGTQSSASAMDGAFQASRMRFSANARKSDVQICPTGQDKSGLTSDTTLKRTSQAGSHRRSAGASCTRRRTAKWTVHDEALVR